MIPKERAESLIKKYGKETALNVVADILDAFNAIYDDWIRLRNEYNSVRSNCMTDYFEDTKKEIENQSL